MPMGLRFGMGLGSKGAGAPTYSYVRLNFLSSAANFYMGVGEIEIRATPGGADLTGGQTFTASSYFIAGGNTPAMAFDNDTATLWVVNNETENGWLQVQFATPIDPKQIVMWPRAAAPERTPNAFQVLGSNNGSTFTTLWTVPATAVWADGVSQTFTKP